MKMDNYLKISICIAVFAVVISAITGVYSYHAYSSSQGIQKSYKQLNKLGEKEIKNLKKQYKKLSKNTKKELEILSNKVVELGKKTIQ